MLDLRWVMWSFYFPHRKHVCAIWRHGISANSCYSYGHKLCSTHSEFIFILLWEGFMSNLLKSKQYDLIEMFNDTSLYHEDIFTIDNPEFEKHILYIYATKFQWNNLKANTSDKETYFFDLDIKALAMTFILALTTNAMTSDFLSSISLGWVVIFLDSYRAVFTFLSLLDLLGVVLGFLISILKIFNSLQNFVTGLHISEASKYIWKVLQVILWAFIQIWRNIVSKIYFWRNLPTGLLLWSSLQIEEGIRCS